MDNFLGTIIEESLENKLILKDLKILKTEIEKVKKEHKTPYLKQWTLHTIEIPFNEIDKFVKKLSISLDSIHSDWYADFKNNSYHYIIFRNKIFKIDRAKPEQYREVVKYGLSLGIPKYQLDFSPNIEYVLAFLVSR